MSDKKYKISSGSGLTASSGKDGTLRVFFISESEPTKISEAYFHVTTHKWVLKTLL